MKNRHISSGAVNVDMLQHTRYSKTNITELFAMFFFSGRSRQICSLHTLDLFDILLGVNILTNEKIYQP